jgi:hypothetical protein
MTKLFVLHFRGREFTVPKGSLFDLFEHQPELVTKASYEVQSSVPIEVFELFVKALGTGQKPPVTQENARDISLLAKEFWLEDLLPGGILNLPPAPLSTVTPPPSGSSAQPPADGEFPLTQPGSLDGIIAHLTRKHGGNVHDKGIVTIASKSVTSEDPRVAVRNVANLTDYSWFCSNREPDQWICWDFHEKRILPTHYTLFEDRITTWVLEGSIDGINWTEIAQQVFEDRLDAGVKLQKSSFAIANPAECRFIRLTQTSPNIGFGGQDVRKNLLTMLAVEFFGTLRE